MTLTLRARFPVWSPSHQVLVADHAVVLGREQQLAVLAEEAKEFAGA